MNPLAPADQSSSPDPSQSSGGYTIEVKVGADKSIQVCVESADDETKEEGGSSDSGDMSDYTPAQDISDALRMVKDIYNNNGQPPQAEDAGMQDAQKGYDSRASNRMSSKNPMDAVFGG